jgi:NitT/TauT family transport system substrate-binding protein
MREEGMTKRFTLFLISLGATITLLSGCGLAAPGKDDGNLKIGSLPILDILPVYIAEQNGYFAGEGLKVEIVPAKSAQERDALMQAGSIDGQVNDLVATGLFNKEKPRIKILAAARKAYPGSPQFRVLAPPQSPARSVRDLAGKSIGASKNTVIEYITDRLLQKEGLSPEQVTFQEVSAIPTRFEMLMNNQLEAATLPDPLGQGAVAAGAVLIADDSLMGGFSQSVLSFSVEAIRDKPVTLRKFLKAWNQAVVELNKNPEKYRDLLIDKGRVPQSIQGTYKMPPFPQKEITTEAEWQDVMNWMIQKKLINSAIPYYDAVDASFLQE